MNWFQENRWLGRFLIVFGICTLIALYFLFSAKGSSEKASSRFRETAGERNRLERLDPFPSEANYRKLKVHIDNYGAALAKFEEESRSHALAAAPLAPNEFQSRLRQAMVASAEKARANRVKLPDNFHLGFDEFTSALPNNELAPLLGQELAQVELLMNILIDARVDSVTAFARRSLPPETAAATTPAAVARKPTASPAPGRTLVERNVVDLTFVAAPSAVRKVLNQIAGSDQQLYIVRTLHVRNEKEKGPAREGSAAGTAPTTGTAEAPKIFASEAAATTTAKPASNAALNFIVGNEHIETSVRIEMLRFTF